MKLFLLIYVLSGGLFMTIYLIVYLIHSVNRFVFNALKKSAQKREQTGLMGPEYKRSL